MGYQNKATSQKLAEELVKKIGFKIRGVDQTDNMVEALLANSGLIQIALTDSTFAVSASVKHQGKLRYKPFLNADFAQLAAMSFLSSVDDKARVEIPKELQREEYAIALHNSEADLLNIVNSAIAKWSKETLEQILLNANRAYAVRSKLNPDEHWKQLQTAACEK